MLNSNSRAKIGQIKGGVGGDTHWPWSGISEGAELSEVRYDIVSKWGWYHAKLYVCCGMRFERFICFCLRTTVFIRIKTKLETRKLWHSLLQFLYKYPQSTHHSSYRSSHCPQSYRISIKDPLCSLFLFSIRLHWFKGSLKTISLFSSN